MAQSLSEDLIESVYQAAVEPQAWNDVMVLLRRQFPSAAQTFYLLRRDSHQIEPISLAGIDAPWLASFNALYFAPDNPWMQLTQRLHRPGIVRTNQRLDTILQQQGVLYRSSYYNEWMRPQGFKYTIGNTLLDDAGLIANITLMRQPDMPSFSEPEVRAFERLSRHMTRALQLAVRIDQPQSSPLLMAALDRLPECIAVTDETCAFAMPMAPWSRCCVAGRACACATACWPPPTRAAKRSWPLIWSVQTTRAIARSG